MERNRITPIRLTTLKEAREIVRSKSSNAYKSHNRYDNTLTPKRNSSKHAESSKKIHKKTIENNLNLIQKAEAVKEAFNSPVRYSTDRRYLNASPVFIERTSYIDRSWKSPDKKVRTLDEEEKSKNEIIHFIKGLEKIRYKLLKSKNKHDN